MGTRIFTGRQEKLNGETRSRKKADRADQCVYDPGRRLFAVSGLSADPDLGESDYKALSIGAAVVFAVAGCWLLWREWKAYRYGVEHKDDPSSWSDEPEAIGEAEETAGEEADDEPEETGEEEEEL